MEERWITLKDGRRIPIKTSDYMNDLIRNKSKTKLQKKENELDKIKTQRDKMAYISNKYKDKLRFPISVTKVKNFITGDQKNGKYHFEYWATTKSNQDLVTYTLEEMNERLNKDIYK